LLAAHLLVGAAGGVAVGLLALLFVRRGWSPVAAAAGALAPALSVYWMRSAADLLSDVPFLAFAAGALLLLEAPPGEGPSRRRMAGALVLAALAFYTRTAGLALLPAAAAALLLAPRGAGRAGWIGLGALAAACAAWFAYGAAVAPGPGGYFSVLEGSGPAAWDGLPARVLAGLRGDYLPLVPSFVLHPAGWGYDAARTVLWLPAGWGLLLGLRKRRGAAPAEVFFLAYLLLVAAWPFHDLRFAIPLAPLFVLFAFEGLGDLARRLAGPRVAGTAVAALALLLPLPNGWHLFAWVYPRALRETPLPGRPPHRVARYTDTWPMPDAQFLREAPRFEAFLAACDLIRRGPAGAFPPGAVLACNPRVAALLCGRPAVRPRPGAGASETAGLVAREKVRLVLVDSFPGAFSDAIRRYRVERPGELEKVLQAGPVEVYSVR